MFYVKQLISQAGRSNSSRIVKDSWPCRAAASIRKLCGRNVLLKDQISESNEVMDNSCVIVSKSIVGIRHSPFSL